MYISMIPLPCKIPVEGHRHSIQSLRHISLQYHCIPLYKLSCRKISSLIITQSGTTFLHILNPHHTPGICICTQQNSYLVRKKNVFRFNADMMPRVNFHHFAVRSKKPTKPCATRYACFSKQDIIL